MKAGTATPPTKDSMHVESARTDSEAAWTTWVGPIRMESSDPQLIGMGTYGIYHIALQRVVDAWQSFPFLVVILSIMAVLGPGLFNVILALGVLGSAGAWRSSRRRIYRVQRG